MARRLHPLSFADLIERILHEKKFFRRRFLIRLMVLVWFCVACWLLVSDQNSGRLITEDDLKFFGFKIAMLTSISGLAIGLTWLLADRKKSG